MIKPEDIDQAIRRIGQTSDGQFLRLGLQRAMMALAPTAEGSALYVFEGGRRFAAQLERLLAGSDTAEIPGDYSSDTSIDRPIQLARPGAVSARASSGARRRVSADPVAKPDASD